MSRSIVTYQLGNYSNFIGSHFWNLHEFDFESGKSRNDQLDDDVTFYEGLTPNTNVVTFTPRLISWDWKENIGPRIIDDVYEESDIVDDEIPQTRRNIKSLTVPAYDGDVAVYSGFTETELDKNKLMDISKDKKFDEWNEYSFSHYHHKTFNWLPKLFRSFNSSNFNLYSQGEKLITSPEMMDKMVEQTRYFVEKCDYLQGFQLIVDCNDAFSGVAMEVTNHVNDEYSSSNLLSFPTYSSNAADDYNSKFNRAVLFSHLNSQSCLWSPVTLTDSFIQQSRNHLVHKEEDYWSSSILALSLKSILLPSITKKHQYNLLDYNSLISGCSNRMCSLGVALPFPISSSLLDTLNDKRAEQIYGSLNPFNPQIVGNCNNVLGTIYGAPPLDPLELKRQDCMYRACDNVNQVMETYSTANLDVSCSGHVRFFDFPRSVTLKHPFPSMFNEHTVGAINGHVKDPVTKGSVDPDIVGILPSSVPVSSVIVSNSGSSQELMQLWDDLQEAMYRLGHLSTELQSIEKDELKEKLELFRMML